MTDKFFMDAMTAVGLKPTIIDENTDFAALGNPFEQPATISQQLAQVHDAFRDLIEAAEAAGWDIGDNKGVLDRARNGFALLVHLHASEVASEGDR